MATCPLILSPEEKAELEQKMADAERSFAESTLPGTVVDLFAWLRSKLDATGSAQPIELDAELIDELGRALDEADDDLKNGRHLPREAVFPRPRRVG